MPQALTTSHHATPAWKRLLDQPRHVIWRAIYLTCAAFWVCIISLLSACGGGDPEDQDTPACAVDGQPRPAEVCR
jgi:hypothetical protein